MSTRTKSDPPGQVVDVLERIAVALEAMAATKTEPAVSGLPPALAYRWQVGSGPFARPGLVPVDVPQLISFDELTNIDEQKQKIYRNTFQFVHGFPANNVLMTGARGTGKSSLVRACLQAFQQDGLRLVEVGKQHLHDLPGIVDCVRHRPARYIIFCDDLTFEEGEHGYQGLKTVLDGSFAGHADNVLVYATSNRKHLVFERMRDNLVQQVDEDGDLHPGDTLEERISLSERFGLTLRFYSFSQDEYLAAVALWLRHFGCRMDEAVRREALRWATQSGSRSGRVALQFSRDYAGQQMAGAAGVKDAQA